ncbi:hypothetical protein SCHPADRAFT_838959 [Schizopora paradoxa]|uniref:Uncharacterized protein n=1 Tax=Schizopora paradoxa TaxID=27342 RepID=A0A0H2RLM9_9AGAM|nr:hypothetical protein SCHPADRAFT_838959 [Schizopora paradoxa]
MAFNQGRPEYFLKFPQELGVHPQVTYEQAANMLLKAVTIAATTPFQVCYIDKPRDGSLFVVFLLPNFPEFPNDGIAFQDSEKRGIVDAGFGRKLEIAEIKNGFVPDEDTAAYRVRRRYRLVQGGNPQLNLIHYSRGQPLPIMPNFMNRPVRKYPLPPLNEPPMFVIGDRVGQRAPVAGNRVPMPGQPGIGAHPAAGMGAAGMHPGQQAAMLAAQGRSMDAAHQRQQQGAGAPSTFHEDDSGDEYDHVTTRSLALARFKRNHDYMHEVFMHAAYGDRVQREIKSPYSCFDEEELKEKTVLYIFIILSLTLHQNFYTRQAKLQKEVDELVASAAARHAAKLSSGSGDGLGDVSMEPMYTTPAILSS